MQTNTKEPGLEALIVDWLAEHNGYEQGINEDYNKEYAIDEMRLFRFLEDIGILAVTTTPKAYEKEITIFKPRVNIKVALGLHPQLVSERYSELSLVEKHIGDAEYIGEIGLDFNSQFYFSKEKQIGVFENVISWCSPKGGKVISIHSVRSDKVVLDVLEKHCCTDKNKCILHWFSGSMTQLRRAVEMGCYFSINGAMIKSPNGHKLIPNIPADKILLESDAPFINDIITPQRLKAEMQGS